MTRVTTPEDSTAGEYSRTDLPVRQGEDPWTVEEIAEVREALAADVARIAAEVELSETELAELMRNHGEGSGDDSADAGGKVFEREQELTMAHHSRSLLEQTRRAFERLENGSYGVCEQCGEPIGKLRLQAFPRATLCVACKQKTERR